MRQRLNAKLNSQSGASLLIALLFFLLCLTVGAVVLTAATANAGRLVSLRRAEQGYLTVSSAARLLRDGLAEGQFQYVTTTVDGVEQSEPVSTADSGVLQDLLRDCGASVSQGMVPLPQDFTVEADGLDPVSGTLAMDQDYTLTLSLSRAGEDGQAHDFMTFTLPAQSRTVRDKTVREYSYDTEETDENGQPILGTDTETTIVETLTVTWTPGDIRKGAAA